MSEEMQDGAASADAAASEAKARQLGWVPKEEYKGNLDKWRTADEFLEFGERLNPILRENNKRLEAQIQDRDKQLAEIRAEVQKFAALHAETEKRAYAKAIADLKEQKVNALESGDYAAVVELDEKIEATKAASKPDTKPQEQRNSAAEEATVREYKEWESANEWINKDEELNAYAYAVGVMLRNKGDTTSGRPFLDRVAEKVKERFPEKFDNPRRKQTNMVEGSDGADAPVKGRRTYANLPKEAQEACDFIVKTTPGYTREKYLAAYKWE